MVFVNYGFYEDFEKLQRAGVDVSGRIVIAKFGKIFRGDKVLNAERFNASGVILYTITLIQMKGANNENNQSHHTAHNLPNLLPPGTLLTTTLTGTRAARRTPAPFGFQSQASSEGLSCGATGIPPPLTTHPLVSPEILHPLTLSPPCTLNPPLSYLRTTPHYSPSAAVTSPSCTPFSNPHKNSFF
ncbi:N-acetylated-alpha-linked acidic dipeptidase 2 [Portunus trituberculatus]|uniref:N-acetylated-alpha-linked acidic dipeptidase 2 n=1 Tax=Portunus trituberculatus TaxID=210409 RepID=A0A5B7GJ56_PORTR|nr:N-acetylated-alpha-linked acidic dipeptidase 2 [Portunus trituberculatus]